MKKKICTILARGGSKGVPRKNLLDLQGLPLICHSIGQAVAAGTFDVIAVSSDSPEILETSMQFCKEIMLVERPKDLASDTAPKLAAIAHCVSFVQSLTKNTFDLLVDLDPTSPLREVTDIHACLQLMNVPETTNVITGCISRRSPYFNMVEITETGVARLCNTQASSLIVTRQSAPPSYDMNASIYVWRAQHFLENPTIWQHGTRLYIMPEERSWDIDSSLDLIIVRELARQRGKLF